MSDQREERADVLVVTAVKDEWDAVLAVETGAKPGGGWKTRTGSIGPEVAYRDFTTEVGELRIAVVQAFGMGREQAVIAAAPLLERHPEIRCLAMCGVCAGRRGDVALGDVVIADRTWPYDSGKLKVTVDEQGQCTERLQGDMDLYRIHPPEWKQQAERFQPDPAAPWIKERPRSYEEQGDWLLERLARNEDPAKHTNRTKMCSDWGKVLEQLWKVKWLDDGKVKLTKAGRQHIGRRMTREPDGLHEPGPFKVVVGPIASGAPVVQDPKIFERLSDTAAMRKVLGLEMEISAILALAYLRKVPHAVVMKGVMDYADAFKSDNMKPFAARASAECLIAFLRQHLPPRTENLAPDLESRGNPLPTLRIPLHFFLSYSREDELFARRLRAALQKQGLVVWADTAELTPHAHTPQRALGCSYGVLLVASPAARDSSLVQGELALAQSLELPIVPVWSSGKSWARSVPAAASQATKFDLRATKYRTHIKALVRRLKEIEAARKPRYVLVRDAYAGWYDLSQEAIGFGVPTYITIQLDEPPYNKPKEKRLRDEKAMLFNPDAYESLQALLDDLYVTCLRDIFPPLTYGARWVLEERSEARGGIHPKRLAVPWEWLTSPASEPIAHKQPYWGHAPANQYGVASGSVWIVREPEQPDQHGSSPRELAFGLAINNESLLEEVLRGPGKQPHPPYRAGFLELASYETINASAYKHAVVALDGWSDRPFAGHALRETPKMFSPDHLK